jgi:diguanylate cyclase (GGDEF)-like protein
MDGWGDFEGWPVGLLVLEVDGTVRSANREAWRLLGTPPSKDPFPLMVSAPARTQVASFLESAVGGDADRVSELSPVLRSADGRVELMLLARRHLVGRPGEGLLLAVVDVTGLSGRVLDSASRDPQTGLINRREFTHHLNRLIASGSRGRLLFMDVDGMKLINDYFGHVVGDEVLRAIADRVVQIAPPDAVVARIGGDEFVILDGTLTRAEGRKLAEAIRTTIDEAPLQAGDLRIRTSVSVGVIGLAGHSADSALTAADEAMYRAKRGATVEGVSEDEERAAAHRSALEFELDQLRRDLTRFRDEARTDHLTGCPNRRGLWEELSELDQRRRRRPEAATIAFVDLDNFREVNKSGGDDHGDLVLATAAGALRDACRPGDVVYRKGGEEFVVTIPGADTATGAQIAERLRKTIERKGIPRGPDAGDGYLTVSIGVASLTENEPGSIFDALLVASRRMFTAKERGRNQVVWRDEPEDGATDE